MNLLGRGKGTERPEVVSRALARRAPIGQPVTVTDVAQAGTLGTTALEPVVQVLAEGALAGGLTAETAEAYIKAEVEKAVRFELDQVGALVEAARQERLVWVGFVTRRRRKNYKVVLPVQMVAQPVADALAESWAGRCARTARPGATMSRPTPTWRRPSRCCTRRGST